MIHITEKMSEAKGCCYCTDKVYRFDGGHRKSFCPYNGCKYKEMDDCETYEEYFHKDIPMSPELQALFASFREQEMPIRRGKFIPR